MEHETQAYFFDLVKRMRTAQRMYFKTRETSYLGESKKLEKEVDLMIQEEEDPNKNQTKLNL